MKDTLITDSEKLNTEEVEPIPVCREVYEEYIEAHTRFMNEVPDEEVEAETIEKVMNKTPKEMFLAVKSDSYETLKYICKWISQYTGVPWKKIFDGCKLKR